MTEWTEISSAGAFAKFLEPGDVYVGTVRNYDPDNGATTFDGDPCGYVDLEDDDGELWRITLDKGALRDPIQTAARQRGMDWINNTLLSVEYTGDRESKKTGRNYKWFTVKVGVGAPAKKVAPSKIKKAIQENLTATSGEDLEAPF